MSPHYFALIFFALTLISYHYAQLHKHVRHRFSWFGFLVIVALPLGYVVYLYLLLGIKILWLYIISSLIGWLLEYSFGRIYYNLEGNKLWKYSKLNIEQYTSWLVLPVWGMAGVIFWSLGKFIGL